MRGLEDFVKTIRSRYDASKNTAGITNKYVRRGKGFQLYCQMLCLGDFRVFSRAIFYLSFPHFLDHAHTDVITNASWAVATLRAET